MAGSGLDGGLDGGSVTGGGGGPTPPPVPESDFAALVAQLDRDVQAHLGAVPVIYAPSSGAPVTIAGVFDAAYALSQGDAEAGVEAVVPAVFVVVADLPADPETDDPTLTIGGVNYRVVERRTAEFGSMVLALRRVV